jgi:tRNA-splicing endonuclease subunit Sen15, fungi type
MTAEDHYESLAAVVAGNLEHQQDWTRVRLHRDSEKPRVLVSGLPPRRLYIHPDEQIELIKAESALGEGQRILQEPEFEWVLPVHLNEKPSVGEFAAIFDSIDVLPPDAQEGSPDAGAEWAKWRTEKRGKRVLVAVVQDDSTVVYYIMHDGIVKPRQN